MKDVCGQIGPVITSPVISMLPEELSTFVLTPGKAITNQVRDVSSSRSLTIADLECPSLGVHEYQSGPAGMAMPVGPPWLPLLVVPSQILSMRSEWAETCRGLRNNGWPRGIGLIDPPMALTRVSDLVPPPDQPRSEQIAAVTSQYPEPSDPLRPGSNIRPVMPLQTFKASKDSSPLDLVGEATPEQGPKKAPGSPDGTPVDPSANDTTEREIVTSTDRRSGDTEAHDAEPAHYIDHKESAQDLIPPWAKDLQAADQTQVPDQPNSQLESSKGEAGDLPWAMRPSTFQRSVDPGATLTPDPVNGNGNSDKFYAALGVQIPNDDDPSAGTVKDYKSISNQQSQMSQSLFASNIVDTSRDDIGPHSAPIKGDIPVEDNLQRLHDALGFKIPNSDDLERSERNTSDEANDEDRSAGFHRSPSTTNALPPLSLGADVPASTDALSAVTDPAVLATSVEEKHSHGSNSSKSDVAVKIYTGQGNGCTSQLLKSLSPHVVAVWISVAIWTGL